MNVVIGVFDPSAAWVLPREWVDRLRREFPQHTIVDAWDREALRRVLPDADVALAAFLDHDLIPGLTRLRWVQAPAAGVGHLLSPELIASPIVLTSSRGIRARAMAEHVLGVTVALSRQLHTAIRAQQKGEWLLSELETSGVIRTLQNRCMGIIGLGAIGTEVAALAAAFGMRVSAVRRRTNLPVPPHVDKVFGPESLHAVLAESDVIVLAAPHTSETTSLLDASALASAKPGALVVNVSRGQLVDDAALVKALKSGRIGGAALDVFTSEPLEPSSPYWHLPNVIVTPHMSGAMEDYWTPLAALFAANLRRFEAGQPLVNVVDKHAGY